MHRTARLSCHEDGVVGNLSVEDAGEQACLDFQEAPVADAVIKQGMGHHRVHSRFVGTEECFAAVGGEGDALSRLDEVVGRDHAGVDGGEDGGIDYQGAEGLHEVEGEGGPAEAGLMVKADEGVEADGVGGDGEILGEDAVTEGEDGVDGIAWRHPLRSDHR